MPVKIDMDMPKNCNSCPFRTTLKAILKDNPICMLTGYDIPFYVEISDFCKFPSWCPIKEVE